MFGVKIRVFNVKKSIYIGFKCIHIITCPEVPPILDYESVKNSNSVKITYCVISSVTILIPFSFMPVIHVKLRVFFNLMVTVLIFFYSNGIIISYLDFSA